MVADRPQRQGSSSRRSLPAALGIVALALAVVFVLTRTQRLGVRDDRARRDRRCGRDALHEPLPARDGLEPDFANSLTVDGAASSHYTLAVMTRRRADLRPGRAPLPGLDVLRVPRAGRQANEVEAPGRGARASDERARPQAERARSRPAPPAPGPAGAAAARSSTRRSASRRRCSCSLQATLLARIVARAFGGAVARRRLARLSCCSALVVAGRACARGASRWPGGAPRRRSLSQLRLDSSSARLRDQPRALDGAESARGRDGRRPGRRRARGVLRPLPAAGRARRRRARRGARDRWRRSTSLAAA